ncbi:hypothetical protein HD554DRAFT_2270122 [Boletus coccyginus]|nr:hypothetical protein HD554DRAFT_2270122 [Boletus coccyginus]
MAPCWTGSEKHGTVTEVCPRFSLKFQQIVEKEQDANFISHLHGGKLNIIPWPVIKLREFYKLFLTFKRCLNQQDIMHKAAGEFLHLMKSLMAKLMEATCPVSVAKRDGGRCMLGVMLICKGNVNCEQKFRTKKKVCKTMLSKVGSHNQELHCIARRLPGVAMQQDIHRAAVLHEPTDEDHSIDPYSTVIISSVMHTWTNISCVRPNPNKPNINSMQYSIDCMNVMTS